MYSTVHQIPPTALKLSTLLIPFLTAVAVIPMRYQLDDTIILRKAHSIAVSVVMRYYKKTPQENCKKAKR